MKPRCSKLVRFLPVLWLVVWAVAPRASAQPRPNLGLQFSAGQPTLTLTGTPGTVYSIQYVTNLPPTNPWVDRALLQAEAGGTVWTDPSAFATSQRFYRAVSVAAPADTNLVFIQPGTFTMGSPTTEKLRFPDETQHVVTISRGFWMGKYLVTQGDYLAVTGSNPSWFNGVAANGTNYGTDLTRPVEMVSWNGASNYCVLRTQQERTAGLIPTNYLYRLPTESEWEYAARAGSTTAFYLGSGLYSGQANFDGQFEYESSTGNINYPGGTFLEITTSVGSYVSNGWGLYDMIGNVWELCQDSYGTYPAGPVVDPVGPASGTNRVIRAGSWEDFAQTCRSAQRSRTDPIARGDMIGFRVVLAVVQ
jgi:formylglycine-generating enzyme required for sulfatase activity